MAEESIVSLAEYQVYTLQIEQACHDWVVGTLSDEVFLQYCQERFTKRYSIREISLKPEDFDWSTIPDELTDACDEALLDYRNIRRLLDGVRHAIKELENRPEYSEDRLAKTAILGQFLTKFSFEYQRLKKSQNPSSTDRLPEPSLPIP